jgi:hypothetical protein
LERSRSKSVDPNDIASSMKSDGDPCFAELFSEVLEESKYLCVCRSVDYEIVSFEHQRAIVGFEVLIATVNVVGIHQYTLDDDLTYRLSLVHIHETGIGQVPSAVSVSKSVPIEQRQMANARSGELLCKKRPDGTTADDGNPCLREKAMNFALTIGFCRYSVFGLQSNHPGVG